MNTFTNHPAAALQVAHQTVADRVADAQPRALRVRQRATRRGRRGADLLRAWPSLLSD